VAPYADSYVWINGLDGVSPASLQAVSGGGTGVNINGNGVFLGNSKPLSLGDGSKISKTSSDGWTPPMWDGNNSIEFQWDGGLKVRIDGSTVLNITTTP
jgi:hypothetical protein